MHACGLHMSLHGHHLLTALYESDVLVHTFSTQFLAWVANLFVLLFPKNNNKVTIYSTGFDQVTSKINNTYMLQ